MNHEERKDSGDKGQRSRFEREPTLTAPTIEFEEGDPDNPFNWPTWRKWTIVSLVTVASFLG